LLPNFTIDKWLKHISTSKHVTTEKYERVMNVLMVTPKELVEIWSWFFRYDK
jgi:hypothetical protein